MDLKEHFGELSYEFKNRRFFPNSKNDYALFALWKDAQPFTERIREHLHDQFKVIADVEVTWSEENFHTNAQRLYENLIPSNLPKDQIVSPHISKIGSRVFRVFVVRDSNPHYAYCESVSGAIELSNKKVVDCKRLFRSWISNPYRVHSTNCIHEFYIQAVLLFGLKAFEDIMSGKAYGETEIQKDLEGANGWKSWNELFGVLNYCADYLVLRNFEELPSSEDDDIDFLSDNYQRLSSAINMVQHQDNGTPYKGRVRVGNTSIPVDIRFVGDGYYDTLWESRMLETKAARDDFYIPRLDHLFFSLLFHAKVQKDSVKDEYPEKLHALANELNLDWYNNELLHNDEGIAKALSGYYKANGYHYTEPMDPGVGRNMKVITFLPRAESPSNSLSSKSRERLARLFRLGASLTPSPVKNLIKSILPLK